MPRRSCLLSRPVWIEVIAFGTGFQPSPDPAQGSLLQTDFTFRKHVDRASPLIQQALIGDTVLPVVQIRDLGGTTTPALQGSEPVVVELRYVQVTGYQFSHAGTDPATGRALLMEEISLNFSESKWIYRELGNDGVLGESDATLTRFLPVEDPAFDDDGDGLSNDLDSDDDNDGILDFLEVDIGMNPFIDDVDGDLDGDGQNNGDEMIAGTLVNDPRSCFGIESFTCRHAQGVVSRCSVALPVVEGRHYRLLATPSLDLPRERWLVISEFEIRPGNPERIMDIAVESRLLQGRRQLYFHAEVRLMD
ncbi:MAG: type VI secretion system tube protein Hcp [Verrucomicrobiales bacterium]